MALETIDLCEVGITKVDVHTGGILNVDVHTRIN
jgi:hypothetical protein